MKDRESGYKENLFEGIYKTSIDSMITIDEMGMIESYNQAAEKMFGYKIEEVLGKNIKMLMPNPYQEEHDEYLKNYRKSGVRKIIGFGREVQGRRKDGSIFPLHLAVNEASLNGKRVFIGVGRDLTTYKETEARAKAVIDNAVDSIITINSSGKIQSMNPAAIEKFGYSLEEVKGENVSMLMPNPYRGEHDQYIKDYLDTGIKKIIGLGRKVVALRKDGSEFPIHLTVSQYQVRGEPHFTGIARDLTEIKELTAQNWLRTGLVKLNQVMQEENFIEALYQVVVQEVSQYLKANMAHLYIKKGKEKLKFVAGYCSAKEIEGSYQSYGEGLAGLAALQSSFIFQNNDDLEGIRMSCSSGQINPQVAIGFPFKVGSKLIAVIELYSLTSFVDGARNYLEAACEPVALTFLSQKNQDKIKFLLEKTQTQQEELQVSNEELMTQQEELKESNKRLKQIGEELEEKALALEKASAYKSEFFATMSHELRTPLNSILILAKTLAESTHGEKHEFSTTIYKAGIDLLGLINDVLDLSKIEAKKMQLEIGLVEIKGFVDFVRHMFGQQFKEKGIYLDFEISPQAPTVIRTDKSKLGRIIKNFLSNALKFTEKGGVKVYVGRPKDKTILTSKKLKLETSVVVSVSDTGVGIGIENLERIFKPFEQEKRSTERNYGGTGLGLSIANEIASLLGGEIQLESRIGEGSTFSLYIPQKLQKQSLNLDTGKEHKTDIFNDNDQFRQRVFVLAGSENNINWMLRLLSRKDLDFDSCLNTRDAFSKISSGLYDLIIIDSEKLEMPLIDFLRHLHTEAFNSLEVPILVYSEKELNEKELADLYEYTQSVIIKSDESDERLRDEVSILLKLRKQCQFQMNKNRDFAFHGRKVLLVDDDMRNVFALKSVLQKKGLEVAVAKNGLDALNKLEQISDIELVLMDMMMPEMDGYEATKRIRKHKIYYAVPVIALTAKAMPIDRDKCIQAGADDYLTKPIMIEKLYSVLHVWLKKKHDK